MGSLPPTERLKDDVARLLDDQFLGAPLQHRFLSSVSASQIRGGASSSSSAASESSASAQAWKSSLLTHVHACVIGEGRENKDDVAAAQARARGEHDGHGVDGGGLDSRRHRPARWGNSCYPASSSSGD
jgi:hypothetical protein